MADGSRSSWSVSFAVVLACASARAAPPGPAAGEASVSLSDILAYADRNAPILAVARARAKRGDAEIEAAGVLLQANPELRVALGPRAARGGVGTDLQLSLEQRFEIAGEGGLRSEAASAFRSLNRSELEQARWRVHQLVHAAYGTAVIARERAAAAERVLQFAERMLEITTRRQAAGDVSAIDVRLAQTELAQAHQVQIRDAAAYRAACVSLAELSGWPIASPPRPAAALEPPRDAGAASALLALARRHNPALRVREQTIREADARVTLSDREAWPEPSIGLSYEREADPGTAPDSVVHVGLLTVGIPLPFWQHNQGERARARADAAAARAEREAFDRALVAQIARAADAVDAAAERVRSYGTEIVPGIEQNLELLRRAYELGELDLLQLMVARGRFLDVQRDALSAAADYEDAVSALEDALGTEPWPEPAQARGSSEIAP